MNFRNNKTMTYEQFVEAVKKESAELPISKTYPERYEKEIEIWEKEWSMKDYESGSTVEGAVYDIGFML